MNVYTIDGSGLIDASGGAGYDGSYASHGGGGGGGFVALYYKYNFFVGELMYYLFKLVDVLLEYSIYITKH